MRPAAARVGHRVQQHQVAETGRGVGGEAARIVPGFDELVDRAVHEAPSPAASASTMSSMSATSVTPSSATARS
ncbi:hypothetical protein [Saccharopolyspora gregorii]|uniref:hypothetical protein n=1 Tax=Saccharopolyspora gregorii TaxID=33914 RepID=UPI0031E8EEDD